MSTNFLFFLTNLILLYIAIFIVPKHQQQQQQLNQTNLVIYVHDYFTGHDASAVTVAGSGGPHFHIMKFGTIAVVDDPVTEGPTIDSKEIGRAQGTYINSQIDGKGLYMVFSVIFSYGDYKGSSLEVQGPDLFSMKEREFGVVSGTGFFRFVKGYGIMETVFLDVPNLRGIIKLNITVKHY
ncbi:Disease resistance-responsive (dirigent-like protein) family protein [Euphorbia peplus]|nr:Disease resistance-responsive (dirigent-like protein) family protein [Euphorbia peplus]